MATAPGFQEATTPSGVRANAASSIAESTHFCAQFTGAWSVVFSQRGMTMGGVVLEFDYETTVKKAIQSVRADDFTGSRPVDDSHQACSRWQAKAFTEQIPIQRYVWRLIVDSGQDRNGKSDALHGPTGRSVYPAFVCRTLCATGHAHRVGNRSAHSKPRRIRTGCAAQAVANRSA